MRVKRNQRRRKGKKINDAGSGKRFMSAETVICLNKDSKNCLTIFPLLPRKTSAEARQRGNIMP